ncbi:MAG TPA: VOC family protein [Ilumatobacteraceae bacterium]|nr:VOC family protein [Ilumatobacteraceae bacterium]
MSDDFPTSIGRLGLVAFDCPDALALADFYSSIIGGDLVPGDDQGWVELHTPTGKLAFQEIADHRAPTWPGGAVPQQGHIDIDVANLDGAEAAVLRLGALRADIQPSPDQFRVMIDPAGHPFCLVIAH